MATSKEPNASWGDVFFRIHYRIVLAFFSAFFWSKKNQNLIYLRSISSLSHLYLISIPTLSHLLFTLAHFYFIYSISTLALALALAVASYRGLSIISSTKIKYL